MRPQPITTHGQTPGLPLDTLVPSRHDQRMKNQVIEAAVAYCGGRVAVAEALNCSSRQVGNWINGSSALPFWAAGALEHLSQGRFARADFYPELHEPLKPLDYYTDRRAA